MTEETGLGLLSGREARQSLPFSNRLLWLVMSLIAPSLMVAAVGLYLAYVAERDATEALLLQASRTMSQHLSRELDKLEDSISIVAQSPLAADRLQETVRRRMGEQQQLDGAKFLLGRPDGTLVSSDSDALAKIQHAPSREQSRQAALQRGVPVMTVHPDITGAARVVVVDTPLPVAGDEQQILSAEITPQMLVRFLAGSSLGLGKWSGAVVSRDGDIIARTRDEPLFGPVQTPQPLLLAMLGSADGMIHLTEPGVTDEAGATVVFSRIPNYDWRVVLLYPQERLQETLNRSLAWLGALVLLAACGVVYAIYMSRQLVRPVSRLATSARQLARGDIIPARRTGITEFDDVQRALRDASQRLARRNADRDQVELMLRSSEQRLRLAMEASELGTWSYDPETNEISGSGRSRELFGATSVHLSLTSIFDALHPAYRDQHHASISAALAGREAFVKEVYVRWPDMTDHWLEVRGRPVMRPHRQPAMVGLVQEITERRSAADRQRVLLRELNHRVKNSLATVQSIALLTRRSTAPDQAWETFEDRLVGLAKTHDLLTASDWRGAWLDEALAAELHPYQNPAKTRILAEGLRLRLHPRATLTLCMCFHELATNAAKYGALSTETGRVTVRWSVRDDASVERGVLHLTWVESGGPAVVSPTRQGLGSRLLDRGLRRELNGVVEMSYPPTGLEFRVLLPLHGIAADNDDASGLRQTI